MTVQDPSWDADLGFTDESNDIDELAARAEVDGLSVGVDEVAGSATARDNSDLSDTAEVAGGASGLNTNIGGELLLEEGSGAGVYLDLNADGDGSVASVAAVVGAVVDGLCRGGSVVVVRTLLAAGERILDEVLDLGTGGTAPPRADFDGAALWGIDGGVLGVEDAIAVEGLGWLSGLGIGEAGTPRAETADSSGLDATVVDSGSVELGCDGRSRVKIGKLADDDDILAGTSTGHGSSGGEREGGDESADGGKSVLHVD